MNNSNKIKGLYWSTAAAIIILVGGFLIYESVINGLTNDVLAGKTRITENTTVYVTKYNGGDMTMPEVYRYYLGDNQQTIQQLHDSEPFLVADNGAATFSGDGNTVNITLTGRIYSFSNQTLFFSQGVAVIPVVNLYASGVR